MSDLYVKCPQCRGSRFVSAITQPGNDWRPHVYGEFACPLCSMTGEAHRDDAAAWIAEQAEHQDD